MNILKKAPVTLVYRSMFIGVCPIFESLPKSHNFNVPNNRNYVLTRKYREFN